ncbi:MAG: histidine phosphatase family protein [Longispora sp.]|nr:histidine phosphatase family protein [Longispora sp. (in: high G+C Gram-positive bacteria)]
MSTSISEHTLLLLRHAKAERPVGVPDEQRPLSARGLADAAAAGEWLAEHGYVPQLVLCSPSRRTKETWRQVAQALPTEPLVEYVHDIYAGGPWELLELIRKTPKGTPTVLVIGHNPTLELLAALLDPQGGGGMRTAEISVHKQESDWANIGARTAPVAITHAGRG